MKKNSKKQAEEEKFLAEIEALITERRKYKHELVEDFIKKYKESIKTNVLSDIDKALFQELEKSNTNLIKVIELIEIKGANINAREELTDGTPLHFAMAKNEVPLAVYLISKGADINFQNSHKTAPIHTAVLNGSCEALKVLIEHGADLTLTQSDGFSPLHCAIIEEKLEIVKILVEAGADLNLFDSRKGSHGTPIHWASVVEDTRIIEYLLEKGADLNVKNSFGKTPLNWARNSENSKTFQILKAKGGQYGV